MKVTALLTLLILILAALPVLAEDLFMWVDDEGTFHVTDIAPKLIVFQTTTVYIFSTDASLRSAALTASTIKDRLASGENFWVEHEKKRLAYNDSLTKSQQREKAIDIQNTILSEEVKKLRLERRQLTLKQAQGDIDAKEYETGYTRIEEQIQSKRGEIENLLSEKDELLKDRASLWRKFHQ